MGFGTYRAMKVVGGRPAFAGASVEATVASAVSIRIDAHEPFEELREAAVAGVRRALELAAVLADVVVVALEVFPADTDAETMSFAVTHATWRALGIAPPVVLELRGRPTVP
jgi:hypothetical protein